VLSLHYLIRRYLYLSSYGGTAVAWICFFCSRQKTGLDERKGKKQTNTAAEMSASFPHACAKLSELSEHSLMLLLKY
jgi:hypothetical protein